MKKPLYEEMHKEINGILYKKCLICENWFPCNNNYFYKNNSSKRDGVSPYCKECEKAKNRKYIKENPEYYIMRNKYKNSHPTEAMLIHARKISKERRENGKQLEY